ncbi:MAG: hypothetical protein U9Q29_06140 [Campylobacterota bacterium]|nr:hypothetical protein [Campylobacterota bacterium]
MIKRVKVYDLKRINKDCFWEYDFSEDDILNISRSMDIKEKKFLFEKILLNSNEMLQDLEIFNQNDLKYFIEDFEVSVFNYEYNFRRKNIAEVCFLNKELLIDELKWVA